MHQQKKSALKNFKIGKMNIFGILNKERNKRLKVIRVKKTKAGQTMSQKICGMMSNKIFYIYIYYDRQKRR